MSDEGERKFDKRTLVIVVGFAVGLILLIALNMN